ncbi:MAG: hypothetical protein Q8936_05535 [Bacillota bacterium]|nr:hypothetical protein [Bacillota bacterium]
MKKNFTLIASIILILLLCLLFYKEQNKMTNSDVIGNNIEYAKFDLKINDKYANYYASTYNYLLVDGQSKLADKSLFLIDKSQLDNFKKSLDNLGYSPSKNLTLFSVIQRDDYAKGDKVSLKFLINGKLYNVEDVVLNNSNETYNFCYVGNNFISKGEQLDKGEVISMVSDPVSILSDATFISGYDLLERTKFKINKNILKKSNNSVQLIMFKNNSSVK